MISLGEETGKTMQTYRESMNATYRRETEALLSVKGEQRSEKPCEDSEERQTFLSCFSPPPPAKEGRPDTQANRAMHVLT